MRLYAVITPPAAALHDLRRAVDAARPYGPDVPWTEPAMWSLMLARFGNLGLHETTIVTQTLSEIGTYCPPLELRFSGAVTRPVDADTNGVDELGVALSGDIDGLWSLARAIPAMVQKHGMFLDRRSFHHDVVVAQGAQGTFPATGALDSLSGYLGPTWTATQMRLVRLIPRGADQPGIGDYEDVERYPFSAPVQIAPADYAGSHRAE